LIPSQMLFPVSVTKRPMALPFPPFGSHSDVPGFFGGSSSSFSSLKVSRVKVRSSEKVSPLPFSLGAESIALLRFLPVREGPFV